MLVTLLATLLLPKSPKNTTKTIIARTQMRTNFLQSGLKINTILTRAQGSQINNKYPLDGIVTLRWWHRVVVTIAKVKFWHDSGSCALCPAFCVCSSPQSNVSLFFSKPSFNVQIKSGTMLIKTMLSMFPLLLSEMFLSFSFTWECFSLLKNWRKTFNQRLAEPHNEHKMIMAYVGCLLGFHNMTTTASLLL